MSPKEKSEALWKEIRLALPFEKANEEWFGDAIQLEFESPNGQLRLWVDSHNNEISIGLIETKTGKTNWHLHMFQLGASSSEEPRSAAPFLQEVIQGKRGLFQTADLLWEIDDQATPKESRGRTWDQF